MREIQEGRAPECADETMRDALPSLDHGRLPMEERQAVEAHIAVCAWCAEELALLRDVRLSIAAAAPQLDLERLARTVAASTRPPARAHADPDVMPIGPRLAARPAAAPRHWGRSGALRAAAAALLMAGGVSAVTLARRGEQPGEATITTPVVASSTPTVAPPDVGPDGQPVLATAEPRPTAARPARGAHVLGQPFDDLSDAELDAVLLAIDDEDAELPALEPAVHASEFRGGGA